MFRIAGNPHEVQQVKADFDLGLSPELQLLTDVHVLDSVVKVVLKDMQPPLLTWELYPEFVELCDLAPAKQFPKLQVQETKNMMKGEKRRERREKSKATKMFL